MKSRIISMVSIAIVSIGCSAGENIMTDKENKNMPQPPIAKKIPKIETLHGYERVDNYYWLKDRDNPDVIDYLEAENDYTKLMMKHTEGLQEKLYKEMVGRIKETDLSVPEKRGEYFYYNRTEEGKQYPIYARKKGTLDAEEEVLLDQNKLAEGYDFFQIGAIEVSPDHNLVAVTVDSNGSERYLLRIKNLETGEFYPDEVVNIGGYSIEWGNDNKTLFYNTLDEAHRPDKVFRHRLGESGASDELVYHEEDDQYFLYPGKTKDGKFLILSSGSATTTEVRYLSADDPMGEFKIFHPRQHMMEYYVYHHADKFYVVTNDDALNFKLMEVSDENPGKDNWKEVLPHREDVKIDYVDMFTDHMAVYERKGGLKQIRIVDMNNGTHYYVEFPEPVYTFRARGNKEFNKKELRFTYTSMITPKSVFDYDMGTKEQRLLKEYEVLGGYDKKDYTTRRIFATAADGKNIPISIVYRNDYVRDGSRPVLLYGYGSYGSSREPSFDSKILSLLDRGFVYALAHVRGGGEMGRAWYEDGKLNNKMNTFTDFIACAEYLISEKYTNKDKLVIYGGSAGGLLMGAVTNMKPDLFELVIASVPFVDVINTMLDETIPLTAIEWEEWGNPKLKEDYDYMVKYSPYDNVVEKDYPNMLIEAGLNDPRVGYWEPAKWTAKLREMKTDNNLLLLKTKMGAGHMGASGRYDYLRDKAFEYALIFSVLGIQN